MLTVLTWWWVQPGGRTTYTREHVLIWAAMVRRHLKLPHRLAVVTDMTDDLGSEIAIIKPPGDFENVRLPTWPGHMPQCLRRVAMYRPDAAKIFGERFVSMDMDCVISGPLDPLFDRSEHIVLYRGTTLQRPYNGSMTMMTAGARPSVYKNFTLEGAVQAGVRYLGSDQAWVSQALGPGEATWGADDGVHAWKSSHNIGDPRITFFLSKDKPWDFIDLGDEWICEHYRGERGGRCLILGYAPSVWNDAAGLQGAFEAVIASPEAVAHQGSCGWQWGQVDAIAQTDDHALRLARMMGFSADQIAFCGRQPERAVA